MDLGAVLSWFTDAEQWRGSAGIPTRLLESLQISGLAIAISVALAFPAAVWLAHLRRGEVVASSLVNLGRAVPSVAVIGLIYPISLRNGHGFDPLPILVALVLIGLPPIFTNTYTAIRGVDAGAVDAARSMGFREREVVARVEVPLAFTLALNGVKIAAVQIVATEPLRAFFGGPGLGKYIQLGYANRANDDPQLLAGAILVAALAMMIGVVFWVLERVVVPTGVRQARSMVRASPNRSPDPSLPPAVAG
jgi:osmoprotectant transport system permease protein